MSEPMSIPISKFKATCLAVIEQVHRTGKPVRITRFGTPLADVVPVAQARAEDSWLGSMRGTARIVGDIIEPAIPLEDWQALRE